MKSLPPDISPLFTVAFIAVALVLYAPSAAQTQGGDNEVTPAVQRLYAEANAASQGGDDAAAIEKYRSIINLAPHLAAAYNTLGGLNFDQHDFAHAAEVLRLGLELNPNMPTAAAILGGGGGRRGGGGGAGP